MQNLIGKSVFNNYWRDNIISSSPDCIIDDEILNICGYVTDCKEIDSNVILSIKNIAVGNINKNNLDIWKDYFGVDNKTANNLLKYLNKYKIKNFDYNASQLLDVTIKKDKLDVLDNEFIYFDQDIIENATWKPCTSSIHKITLDKCYVLPKSIVNKFNKLIKFEITDLTDLLDFYIDSRLDQFEELF